MHSAKILGENSIDASTEMTIILRCAFHEIRHFSLYKSVISGFMQKPEIRTGSDKTGFFRKRFKNPNFKPEVVEAGFFRK